MIYNRIMTDGEMGDIQMTDNTSSKKTGKGEAGAVAKKREVITELTPEQEALLPVYAERGIAMGLKPCDPLAFLDALPEFRRLTDAHRELVGLPKATHFLHFRSPMEAMREVAGINQSNAIYGQHEIGWLITYFGFYREVLGFVEETEPLQHLYKMAEMGMGWFWMSSNATVISMPPTEVHITEDGTRTHNADGPAILYADGEAIYCLGDITVPRDLEWIVTTPVAKLDKKKISGIENTELRSEAMKRYGLDRFREGQEVLDTWESKTGGVYALVAMQLPDEDNRRVYLSGKCPSSGKPFYEGVPPELSKCQQALTWREGRGMDIPAADTTYIEPEFRT